MKAAVVLFSGGMDSTICLHWAKRKYGLHSLRALSFHYGQPHADAELAAAARIAADIGLPSQHHIVLRTTELFPCRGLLESVVDEDGASGRNVAFVPNRNFTLLSIAAGYATSWFPMPYLIDLVIGCCREDLVGFPDCDPGWLTPLAHVLSGGNQRTIGIQSPLSSLSKVETLSLATDIGALDDALSSWSCYRGRGPCGTCHACVVRERACQEYAVVDNARAPTMTGGDLHRGRKL